MSSPFEASTAAHRPDQILIQFEDGVPAATRSHALEAIGGRLEAVVNGEGGGLARVGLGEGVTVEKALHILSKLPGVKFAEPDFVMTSDFVSNDASVTSGATWGLYGDEGARVNTYGSQAVEAWADGHVGSTKVAVGVVDTGVDYTHMDLYLNVWLNQGEIPVALRSLLTDTDGDQRITFRDLNQAANAAHVSDINANGRIDGGDLLNDARWENGVDDDANGYRDDLVGWDFQNGDNDPMDDAGHGTHVAGTIGATGGNGVGVAGVNWNVQLVALKFSGAAGGYTSHAIQAQDYFIAASRADTRLDFVATNNSYGAPGAYSQAFQDSVVRDARADVLFVASAGNGGSDQIGDNNDLTPSWPTNYSTLTTAGYDAVVSVAALTSAGTLAAFSNYGPVSVDLAAPGHSIYSTLPGGGYGYKSGTSMASPHVAGAIALYAAANPGASAAEIRAALFSSTTATASLAGKVATGGRLDIDTFVHTVVELTDPAPAPAPAPAPQPPATGVLIVGTAGADMVSTTSAPAGQSFATAYADTIQGQAGNDTLNGGAGADSLAGGTGSDIYVLDNGDVVFELLGEGEDLVQTSLSHTLAANVERLTLTGSAAVNGTGNELGNIINGNGAANVLSGLDGADQLLGQSGDDKLIGGAGSDSLQGGSGADTLTGGAGVDLYVGGAGKDRFVLEHGASHDDRIQDFAKGDMIYLQGYSAGSSVTKVAGSSTDWMVRDAATNTTEVFHLLNGHGLKGSEFLFI